MRHQLASIISAKDAEQEKYEKMLTEENRKNKELSEDIEELHRKELHYSSNNDMSGSPRSSGRDNNSTVRKRRRNVEKEVEVGLGVGGQHEHASPGRSENTLDKENLFSDVFVNSSQAKCCHRRLEGSVNGSDNTICLFQELVESLLDLKFSIATQSDQNIQIIAVHESSGYSFSLGWVNNAVGEEELMYRVFSLGTFERIAPEWMRDVMLFSKSMCRVFFQRVSHIV